MRSVRWRVAGRIAIAWLITLPAAAAVAAAAELIARIGPAGIAIDAALATGAILFMFIRSRRKRVAHHNVTDHDETPAKKAKTP